MNGGKPHRNESEFAWLSWVAVSLARGLYLLPSLAAAVALATPVSDLRLPDRELEARTLLGIIGEFSDLRSATGVQPVIVITFAALLVILGTGVVVAWPGEWRPNERPQFWRLGATILTAAGIVLVVLTLPLAWVLNSADHAVNDSKNTPFVVHMSGLGMLVLTGVIAATVAHIHRKICD